MVRQLGAPEPLLEVQPFVVGRRSAGQEEELGVHSGGAEARGALLAIGQKSEVAITIAPFGVLISSAPSRFKSDLLAFGGLLDSVETVSQLVGFRPDPIRIRSILAAGTSLGRSISLLRNEL